MSYRVEALAGDHAVDRFSSGRPPLDEWLRSHARGATGFQALPADRLALTMKLSTAARALGIDWP